MRRTSPKTPKTRTRPTKKIDWSSATRPHQVQDPRTLIKHSIRAKRTRQNKGGTYQDQSP
jgi:hypothetical protein